MGTSAGFEARAEYPGVGLTILKQPENTNLLLSYQSIFLFSENAIS